MSPSCNFIYILLSQWVTCTCFILEDVAVRTVFFIHYFNAIYLLHVFDSCWILYDLYALASSILAMYLFQYVFWFLLLFTHIFICNLTSWRCNDVEATLYKCHVSTFLLYGMFATEKLCLCLFCYLPSFCYIYPISERHHIKVCLQGIPDNESPDHLHNRAD